MGCVYLLTFPNGKKYVGISRHDTPGERLRRHMREKRKFALANAIRKYGKPRCRMLKREATWKILQDLERAFILKHNTKAPYGYNLTLGGDGTLGHKCTAAQRRRMSEAHIGLPGNRTGSKLTIAQRKRLSEAHMGQDGSAISRWLHEHWSDPVWKARMVQHLKRASKIRWDRARAAAR